MKRLFGGKGGFMVEIRGRLDWVEKEDRMFLGLEWSFCGVSGDFRKFTSNEVILKWFWEEGKKWWVRWMEGSKVFGKDIRMFFKYVRWIFYSFFYLIRIFIIWMLIMYLYCLIYISYFFLIIIWILWGNFYYINRKLLFRGVNKFW